MTGQATATWAPSAQPQLQPTLVANQQQGSLVRLRDFEKHIKDEIEHRIDAMGSIEVQFPQVLRLLCWYFLEKLSLATVASSGLPIGLAPLLT